MGGHHGLAFRLGGWAFGLRRGLVCLGSRMFRLDRFVLRLDCDTFRLACLIGPACVVCCLAGSNIRLYGLLCLTGNATCLDGGTFCCFRSAPRLFRDALRLIRDVFGMDRGAFGLNRILTGGRRTATCLRRDLFRAGNGWFSLIGDARSLDRRMVRMRCGTPGMDRGMTRLHFLVSGLDRGLFSLYGGVLLGG
jgi:hypothetical protein